MKSSKNKFTGLVYVISENYELLYLNQAMKELFPLNHAGCKCYEFFMNKNEACRACPVRTGRQRFYFNQVINNWLKIDAANIDWPGDDGDAYIFKVDRISNKYAIEYFLSLYDTSGHYLELNLDRNECLVFYSNNELGEGKLGNRHEANFSAFVKTLADKHVHPRDKESFLEFWDVNTMAQRLKESWQEGILINEFIEKDRDGNWQVVLHLIIDIPRAEGDEHIVRCFNKVQPTEDAMFDRQILLNNAISKMGLDNLTGLARESAFFKKAEKFLADKDDGPYCIIAIDIPNFWIFNKQNSHEVGDRLLIEISNVLKNFQLNINAVAGYFGNDDFAIVLPMKRYLIEQLYAKLNACLIHYEQSIPFTIKLSGYTLNDPDISMSVAYDYALNAYDVVGQFHNKSIKWYNPQINFVEKNYEITKEAMDALKRNEFVFYLQAQVDNKTGKVVGAESLVRWVTPKHGVVCPADFIPVLEHTGLVSEVDLFVWTETIKWMGKRLKEEKKVVPISINISRIDIVNLNVIDILLSLTDRYQVPHGMLKLEITETSFMDDRQNIRHIFDQLRKYGFKVMLDDFGSGLSSLCTLDNINVDFLKLDMELVRFRERNFDRKVSIVASIVEMSKSLKLPLVAEGIETEEQLCILKGMGVEYGQGLLFYRALPVEEFEKVLDAQK